MTAEVAVLACGVAMGLAVGIAAAAAAAWASAADATPPAGLRRRREVLRDEGVSVVDGLVIRGTGACAGLVVDAGPSPAAATYTCSTADPRLRRREVVRLRAGWVREESGLDLGRGWDRGG